MASNIREIHEGRRRVAGLVFFFGLASGFALAAGVYSVPLGDRASQTVAIAIIALLYGIVVLFSFARGKRHSARNDTDETPAWHLRFDVEKYHSMSEGQRQAYIGGVLDMICFSYPYIAPRYQRYIVTMDAYFGRLDIGEIKNKFEEYLESPDGWVKHSAAGALFNALYEWTGLDGKKNARSDA